MQCFSLRTCHAGIANFLTGYNAGGVSMTYNGFSKAVTAALLFKASASFDRAVTASSCNMAALLSAIGPEGLTKLWHQLTIFAWTVALSQASLRSVHPRHPAVCPWAGILLSRSFGCQPPYLHRPQKAVASVCCFFGESKLCAFHSICTWSLQDPLDMSRAPFQIQRVSILTCAESGGQANISVHTRQAI